MKVFIKRLLREAFMPEAEVSSHTHDRIRDRIKSMGDEDLNPNDRAEILNTLEKIKNTDFPPKRSYVVLLGQFRVNPDSQYFADNSFGYNQPYYEIEGSIGDQFWVVIRENKITTFMLTRSQQTKDNKGNAERVRVDYSISNFDRFLDNLQKTKQVKQTEPIVSINGVKWMVNSEDETIFKKNKPTVIHRIEDVLDNVDEPTQEKIMSFL